jgi:hypothetical protein
MDSADHCRANLAECRGLLPSAQNDAEATVLKTLVRSWKMIANQLEPIRRTHGCPGPFGSKAASVGGFFHSTEQ